MCSNEPRSTWVYDQRGLERKLPWKKKSGGQNQETQTDISHLTEEQKGITRDSSHMIKGHKKLS